MLQLLKELSDFPLPLVNLRRPHWTVRKAGRETFPLHFFELEITSSIMEQKYSTGNKNPDEIYRKGTEEPILVRASGGRYKDLEHTVQALNWFDKSIRVFKLDLQDKEHNSISKDWCASFGETAQISICGLGSSPTEAVKNLLENPLWSSISWDS